MNIYDDNKKVENDYLRNVLSFIKKEILSNESALSERGKNLIEARREMWEETSHSSEDFDKIPEMNDLLNNVDINEKNYTDMFKKIKIYYKMYSSPYFGRIDFKEDGEDLEKIYIGIHSLIDDNSSDVLVYDWRTPIASLFYECEEGTGTYKSPVGLIRGNITLKRQYKIENSKLKYFFDSSIKINDELLQEVLGQNSSDKMKNIVRTIQKEQNMIIRDTKNKLLVVQGVAGSGKTSIALHRIAYLLYTNMNSKLTSKNIIIISPNNVFSEYISDVLPELGEENVEDITYEDILKNYLDPKIKFERRFNQLENLILLEDEDYIKRMEAITFKGSRCFIEIIKRYIKHYKNHVIPFHDVYYDGKIIAKKEEIKSDFLNNKLNIPPVKQLKRIESSILNKLYPLRKERIKKIEAFLLKRGGHEFEIKSFSRLLSMKESKSLVSHIHEFTEINYVDVYKKLFCNKDFFLYLSKGLHLPDSIEEIIEETEKNINMNSLNYEDCTPLLFIKLVLEGNQGFSSIQEVFIDEAQDYYDAQYEVFNLLFNKCRYTILGDYNQTLEKPNDPLLYDNVGNLLNIKDSCKLSLNKSYRSSLEISEFCQKILKSKELFTPFRRQEVSPQIISCDDLSSMLESIEGSINSFSEEGYKTMAIICKTLKESENLKSLIINDTSLNTINLMLKTKKLHILPSYIAKGLEYDVVFVYNVSNENYNNMLHKRLLYAACTRALHRLSLYYIGKKSSLIP